jgi:diguanylate cyclase (GGDEF)-like protein
LLCDVDQLSSLNARHGRAVGDQLLQTIAQRLRGTIRDGDLLCRFGGDEFLVVLQSVAQLEHALAAAGTILDAAHQPLPGLAFTPSLSIGATLLAADEALDGALQRADAATHAAKAGGGHQVVVMAGTGHPLGPRLGTGTTRSGRARER